MEEVVEILCEAEPDFLILDDDFRILLNGMGCFCQEHLARFAKLAQKHYSRENLQKILNQIDLESVRMGNLYRRMLMDTLQEAAAGIRKTIDRKNPELRCGFCTSSEGEYAYAAETAKILAGQTEPFVRLNNGFYIEDGSMSFPYRQMCNAIQQHYVSREVSEILSECDTFPHNRYSLSTAGLHLHICSSLLSGCSGIKMWIDNLRYHHPSVTNCYLDLLKKTGGCTAH